MEGSRDMRLRRRALTGEFATAVTASGLEDLTASAPPTVTTPGTFRKGQRPVAVIKVSRLWPTFQRSHTAASLPLPVTAPDGLDAFGSESEPRISSPPPPDPGPEPSTQGPRNVGRTLRWATVIILSSSAAAGVTWQYQRRATAAATGSLTIQTIPSGVGGAHRRSAGRPYTAHRRPSSGLVRRSNRPGKPAPRSQGRNGRRRFGCASAGARGGARRHRPHRRAPCTCKRIGSAWRFSWMVSSADTRR